jgi:hypothetical protein
MAELLIADDGVATGAAGMCFHRVTLLRLDWIVRRNINTPNADFDANTHPK